MQAAFDEYVAHKRITGSFKDRLSSLNGSAAEAVRALITQLDPSANTLRTYLRLAEEIALRDAVPVSEILSDGRLVELACGEGSRKERQKRVRQALEARRYPEIHRIQSRVEGCLRTIAADTGLRVELPADLEGDTVRITVGGRDPEELSAAAAKIELLGRHPALKELFAILRGER